MKLRSVALVALLTACTGTSNSGSVVPEGPASSSSGVPVPAVLTQPVDCPSDASVFSHVVTNRYPPVSGSARWIVPGDPTGGVACVSQQRTELIGASLRSVVDLLNGLKRMLPGSSFCPMDTGRSMALFFDYGARAVQFVRISLSGCTTASNGTTTGWLDPPSRRLLLRSVSPLPMRVKHPGVQRFVVAGSLAASTASVTEFDGYCSYRDGTFTLQTDPMRLGGGPAVARLSVTIPGFTGVGRYSGTTPRREYGRTPVYLTTGRDTASGAATSEFGASTGHVTINSVTPLDTPRRRAIIEGTLRALLRQRYQGHGEISVQGSWRCTTAEPRGPLAGP
jgi:hypothetical protein